MLGLAISESYRMQALQESMMDIALETDAAFAIPYGGGSVLDNFSENHRSSFSKRTLGRHDWICLCCTAKRMCRRPGIEWCSGGDGVDCTGSGERDLRASGWPAPGCDPDPNADHRRGGRGVEPGCAVSRMGSACESLRPLAAARDQSEGTPLRATSTGFVRGDVDPDCRRGVDSSNGSQDENQLRDHGLRIAVWLNALVKRRLDPRPRFRESSQVECANVH